jgi:hypothetical protein
MKFDLTSLFHLIILAPRRQPFHRQKTTLDRVPRRVRYLGVLSSQGLSGYLR